MDVSALLSVKAILRWIELVFSIIVFAVVAEYDGTSKINFTIFTGVTAMCICIFTLIFYLFDLGENPTVILIELIINTLWWIFWLCTAAVLSSIVDSGNSRIQASCAFSWLTWLLWSASTFISFRDTRNRSGGGSMPAGPQPNVAMV